MQLKFHQNIIQPYDGMRKISALAWSPNGLRMAISTADRVIQLYDEHGTKKDKFPTKSSEDSKSYVVRALEFSPDSIRIALAQSDNIVFVYKLGENWGDRKAIVNKFPASSSVTCLAWPRTRPNQLVFGLAEGKIKCGTLNNNKSQVLYSTDSYCVSLAAAKDGERIVSGHLDGSIFAYHIESQAAQKVVVHHSIPYALEWGEQIVAAGNDAKVSFYDSYGNLLQRFDYSTDDKVREFTLAKFNPSGDTVVLGNFNRFYTYHYNAKRGQWEQIGMQHIDNYYTVTALCWKNDGAKLITGSLCGSVDMYNASMKTIKYKGKFELNYVSPSQIVIKILASGNKSVVRSSQGEISDIKIFQDRFFVAYTTETILICDLNISKTSEIMWRGSGKEKFDFSNPNVCMIFNAGELTLIEYGNNEPLGNCRTEHMKSALISARLNYFGQNTQGTKIIAYLLDLQTLCIQDLQSNVNIAQVNHDSKIDFLELNAHANKLLFRDKRRQLYLYNIKTQTKSTLLSYCSYAQWVPQSEVVVAQNRNNLCVWYSIEHPDKVTIYNIKGDVETIERNQGKTEVIVNDGNNTVAYALDEPLIEFGFAVESQDLERAAQILDPLEMNPETEANWKTLSKLAVEQQNISVAEHCFASLGDISKAAYLRKIDKLIRQYEKETGKTDGMTFYKVQAKLAVLEKQFHRAEAILLDHNEVEEAMEMYQELHKWDESIKIAEKVKHPDLMELKQNYHSWLIDTNQEEKVGEVKEQEGDFLTAITFYLKGGLPARAANVVFNYNYSYPQEVLQKIAQSLENSGMYEKAGEFYEQLENMQKALDNYCKGNAYNKAVELAKRSEPRIVAQLEERWGDYLISIKQTESAVNHYIEANSVQKAIEAAISCRQWNKAIQLLQHQNAEVSRPYYKQIAKHYADVRQYDFAEKYYLKSGQPVDAFEMYARQSKWDQALRVARDNLPESEIVMLYVKQAEKFEQQQMYKEAEKLFTTVEVYDLAINMYKKAELYDQMVRLVQKHRPDLLKDTHLSIAQKLQRQGNYKQAEHHFIESGAWHGAVEMYKQQTMWEEAVHVCKLYGSDKETCELAKQWAEILGPEKGMEKMIQMNLIGAVIEYLCDRNEFDEAFRTAKQHAKPQEADVHLKYAFHLEDEKRYKEAEDHFIKAGKPMEAINMYEHLGDFHSALQVARLYDQHNVPNILINQAKTFIEKREYSKAENSYLQAKKPELALKMYQDISQLNEALRVAKKYLHGHVPIIMGMMQGGQGGQQGGGQGNGDLFQTAKLWEQSQDYYRAIEAYLDINSQNTQDPNQMEEAWKRAFQLTMQYDSNRVMEVVNVVAKRLNEIQRYEAAGQILEQVQQYREAIYSFLRGQLFPQAEQCLQQVRDAQMHNELSNIIQGEKQKYLGQKGDAEELCRQGQVQQGVEMMIKQNNWQRALQCAQQYGGGETLARYLVRYAKVTMEAGKFGDTISAFSKYGMQAIPQNYPIYKTLALEIFVDCDPREIQQLRSALFNFFRLLEGTGEHQSPAGKEFGRYLFVSHLLDMKTTYQKKDILPLYTASSVSAIRYCDLVRLDQLYYDAGTALQKSNDIGFALVLLNRYLDIYEVIEDPNNNNIQEQQGFELTDIPLPYDVPIPESNIINKQQIDKMKDWILNMAMSQQHAQELPMSQCNNCGQGMYDAGLRCVKCRTEYEPCIITGYPIKKGEGVQCRSCGKMGLKKYWNVYLQHFTNCPWCNNAPN